MRKQTLKALTMLVSIVALAFATAVVTNAQSHSPKIRANVPFDFVVGDKTLAAGEYSVGQITAGPEGLLIRCLDGGQSVLRLTNAVLTNSAKNKTSLTFRRYGSTYYLAQVWIEGSSEGREILKSKSERAAERELAKNSSTDNLAQKTKPEIVTIIAEIE